MRAKVETKIGICLRVLCRDTGQFISGALCVVINANRLPIAAWGENANRGFDELETMAVQIKIFNNLS